MSSGISLTGVSTKRPNVPKSVLLFILLLISACPDRDRRYRRLLTRQRAISWQIVPAVTGRDLWSKATSAIHRTETCA
jgi:hypothetical protein